MDDITAVEKVAFSLVAFVISLIPVVILLILKKNKAALIILLLDLILITSLLYIYMT